jgi:hypothetical protein
MMPQAISDKGSRRDRSPKVVAKSRYQPFQFLDAGLR